MTTIPRKDLWPGGPAVARLCLGTMTFGDQTSGAEAGRILAAYQEAGGNFIDTADVYAVGESERILGRILPADRSGLVLATKVGNRLRDIEGSGGLSRRWIGEAVQRSLDRLRTDSVDIYYLHLDDQTRPRSARSSPPDRPRPMAAPTRAIPTAAGSSIRGEGRGLPGHPR